MEYEINSPFSSVLTQKVVEFLATLPGLEQEDARRAWLFSAALDVPLQQRIHINGTSAQFFQLLVQTVGAYGKLQDGRLALEAVLEAARQMVGYDRKKDCERLIQQIQTEYQRNEL